MINEQQKMVPKEVATVQYSATEMAYRRLAAAVVKQAWMDLNKGRGEEDIGPKQLRWQTAREFFDSDMYPFIQLLGLNPLYIREHLPEDPEEVPWR